MWSATTPGINGIDRPAYNRHVNEAGASTRQWPEFSHTQGEDARERHIFYVDLSVQIFRRIIIFSTQLRLPLQKLRRYPTFLTFGALFRLAR